MRRFPLRLSYVPLRTRLFFKKRMNTALGRSSGVSHRSWSPRLRPVQGVRRLPACPHTAPSSPRRLGCPHLTCLDEPGASAATYARAQLTRRNLFFLQRGATYMKEPKFTTPWSQVHGGAGTSSAGAAVGEEPGPGAPDGPHTPLRLPSTKGARAMAELSARAEIKRASRPGWHGWLLAT